jgi:hypothetical protein
MLAAGAIIAGLTLSAGLTLDAAPAFAAPSLTVNFTGGVTDDQTVCESTPSVSELAVPPQTRVLFANRLDRTSALRIDGQEAVTVEPDEAVPVTFHRGPISVSMTFACDDDMAARFSPVSVTVAGSGSVGPMSVPNDGPAATGVDNAAAGGGGSDGTGAGFHGRPASAPDGPGSGTGNATGDSASTGSGANGGPAAPDGSAAGSGGAGSPPGISAPGASGSSTGLSPTGPQAAGVPSAGTSNLGADGVPTDNGGTGVSGSAVAIDPVVPASGTPRDRGPGLLALLTVVCVAGVTIAWTRAIISKRTIQTPHA